MYSKTPIYSMLLCAVLALAGCSKGSTASTTPGEPQGPALTLPISSEEDYITKATLAFDRLTAIFKSANTASGTDCDKVAAELSQFIGENEAFLKALHEYETAHPDAQAKLDARAKSNMTAFAAAAEPVAAACKDNKGVQREMAKLTNL